ncbi:glycosyltransferase family 2 protein [Vibrio diabolicus]|uniref:glycosyltransferase family 2 protein n=1 Tax=Vibrio diabolicus TaxID=50719 RepID=UPI00293FFECB|nr:glycosyltransferase family 2 protein [Vibrio diabolicus]MDV5037617.1 glycosyltransferase family 2 protein [Vibrio diabolicus]
MKAHCYDSLVSIVMPSYNSSRFIAESIESALNQSHTNLELIIVDNLSTDDSLAIAREYAKKDPRVRVYECDKKGAAHARNVGIDNAKGRYLAFLDSDDIWTSTKLDCQLGYMNDEGVTLSCSSYQPFCSNGLSRKARFVSGKLTYNDLLKTCQVGCSTVIIDRKYHSNISFPAIYKEDYALWLELCRSDNYFGCYPEVLTYYRVYRESLSANKLKEAARQWNIYRKQERLSLLRSIYYLTNYTYYGLKKRG